MVVCSLEKESARFGSVSPQRSMRDAEHASPVGEHCSAAGSQRAKNDATGKRLACAAPGLQEVRECQVPA